jgi:hypothetical protein
LPVFFFWIQYYGFTWGWPQLEILLPMPPTWLGLQAWTTSQAPKYSANCW